MKLLFSIVALLAPGLNARLNDVQAAVGEDMTDVKLKCNFGFKLSSDTHEAPKYDEQSVTQCLQDSYNEYHDPTKYAVKGVEVDKTVVYEVPLKDSSTALGSDDIEWDFTFVLGIYSFIFGAFCDKWCSPYEDDPYGIEEGGEPEIEIKDYSLDLGAVHHHPEWELRFCACLQNSDDVGLNTAHECQIRRADSPTEDFGELQDFKPNGIDLDQGAEMLAEKAVGDDMTDVKLKCNFGFKLSSDTHEAPKYDEQSVTQCLQDSYNEYHDPTKYAVKGVEVDKTVVYEVPLKDSSTALGSDDIEWDFTFVLGIYSFVYGAFCDKFCSPYEDDPFGIEEGGEPEIEIKDYSLDLGAHHHPEWELRFCACLQNSDDVGLNTAHECQIRRADSPTEDFGELKDFKPNGIDLDQGAEMLAEKAMA